MTDTSGGQVLDTITRILPLLGVLVAGLFITGIVIGTICRVVSYIRKLKQEYVLLEVTPPAFKNKVPLATTQLFSVLHGLYKNRSLLHKLFRQNPTFALEIVSSRKDGIRYLIRASQGDAALIQQTVLAYAPGAKVRQAADYLTDADKEDASVRVYKQANHFAHPIDTTKSLSEHDPVAYLTAAMTKLSDNELIGFQLVVTPSVMSEASKIDRKIRAGNDAGSSLQKRFSLATIGSYLILIIKLPFIFATGMIQAFLYNDLPNSMKSSRKTYYNPEALPPAEQELVDSIHDKLNQDLFYADIRSLVVSGNQGGRKDRQKAIANSLATFSTPKFQQLKPRMNLLGALGNRLREHLYQKRLPSLLHFNSAILGSAELAAIFHFPHSRTAQTENVAKSLSKTLPAPISMKGGANLDVIFGVNPYHDTLTPIGLTADQRERHTYIIGGTGNGKTTMLEFAIIQDMRAGKGLAFIDPHGDAAEKLLRFIPKDRIKDVVYLNPADIVYPIGINLLELPEGLDEDALIMEKERVTEAVVSILRKVFADDEANAHRIEAMLRNAIRTAFYVEDANLFTILKLFRNTSFRNSVVAKLDDDDLKDFWREEFGKAGSMQRVSMSKGLTNRLDRFRASAPVYRMFSQTKSTISFEDIMNEGKILICNFSSEMGEDTSTLFGTTVLAKLKIAAERRKNIPPAERRPFHVYVDEFQNFATTPFTKMLSTARKYKLFLTIAEQSTTQQEEQRMVETILANVGTMITFRTGSPIDEQLMLARFRPFVEEGDIANLPAFNFYMRVAGVQTEEPMSGETLLLENEGSSKTVHEVIASSRKQFAKKYVASDVKQKGVQKHGSSKSKPRKAAKVKPKQDEEYIDV